MPSLSATQDRYPFQNVPTWSKLEKGIARRALDAALRQELLEVTQKAKRMANEIRQPSELWDLEHYLTECRKEIDRKYDYRYSHVTEVLGRLLHERRVSEDELRGLREDKMKLIHSFAEFLARDAVAS